MASRREVADLRAQGMTNHEISRVLGINSGTVWKWFGPSPNCRHALLTPEVRDHLERKAADLEWQGLSFREISAELGVPRSTVHGWLRRSAA